MTRFRRLAPPRARLALVLAAASALAACGGSPPSSPTAPSAPGAPTYTISETEMTDMLSEKVMGNTSTSVSIIEYSALTCPHCASFHVGTLPQLKAAYIDTGKVKLVYRDFPVQGAASNVDVAYAAAALARCAGGARYFDAIDLLYRGQASWVGASNPTAAMKQTLASIGMSSEKMDACVANTRIRGEIDRVVAAAGTTVRGTPTFFIGNQKIEGSRSFADLDAILKVLVQ